MPQNVESFFSNFLMRITLGGITQHTNGFKIGLKVQKLKKIKRFKSFVGQNQHK